MSDDFASKSVRTAVTSANPLVTFGSPLSSGGPIA